MDLKPAPFTEMLIEANGLEPQELGHWAFCPGMLFGSPDKWWGDHGRRDFPHEGIDLCLYHDSAGRLLRLDPKTRIPVIRDGVVRAIFSDYLGHAVVVAHDGSRGKADRYISVYAHTEPMAEVKPGGTVKQGDIIATIADTGRSKAKILPHLHFSLGRPSLDLRYEPFIWNIMRDPERVTLLDPLKLIGRPCRMLDSRHAFCRSL